MGLALLPLLLSLQVPSAGELAAAAQASPEPRACAVPGNVWRRTQEPLLAQECRLLAQGYAILGTRPAQSLVLSQKVKSPGLAANAKLLEARSLLRGGHFAQADRCFSELAGSPGLLQATAVLRERAAAAWLAGSITRAVGLYRNLIPRVGLLPAPERAPALLEAALAIAEQSRSQWPEARSLLRRAVGADELRGAHVVASGVANLLGVAPRQELQRGAIERFLARPNRIWLSSSATLALRALAAEEEDPEAAARYWAEYSRLPSAVFAAGASAVSTP